MTCKLNLNSFKLDELYRVPTLRVDPSSSSGHMNLPIGNAPVREFCNLLSKQIPSEWQDSIRDIMLAERKLVEQRQALIVHYREQFRPIAKQFASTFAEEYPELQL